MKKVLIGMIFIAGLFSVSQVWAVSGNTIRENNQIKNKIKEDIKEINGQVKEKLANRVGELKLLKSKKASISQGEITAISGITLTIKKDDKTYTVLTDDKTQFRRKFWGVSEIAEMSVGDMVNVMGKWTDDTQTIIQAISIKDTSIQMRHGVFFGEVKSISGNTIVINSEKRGEQTVTISETAEIVNRKQEKISPTDILVGHRIRVRGLWNSLKSTITEVTQIKDFSLPIQPKSSVLPTVEPTVAPTPVTTPTV